MRTSLHSNRPRGVIAVVVAALTLLATLVLGLSPAGAAAGPLQPLKLPGTCNPASWAIAQALDAQLAANKASFTMIQQNQPKAGETGYNDATVGATLSLFATAIDKPLQNVTAADVTAPANKQALAKAVADGLQLRTTVPNALLTWTDGAKNAVFLWCLAKNANHGGPDLGLLYVPVGKAPANGYWIAGCVLAGGMNTYEFSLDKATFNFAKFVWTNTGPQPGVAGSYIQYIYEYDVAANILKITQQIGKYDQTGTFVPSSTTPEANPAAPPGNFQDLKLNGKQISLNDGGCACPAQNAVAAVVDQAAPAYGDFVNTPISGSGTVGDPYVGVSPTIQPGDTVVVDMPAGTEAIGDGTDPNWLLLTPGATTALFQYEGASPLTLAVGRDLPDVVLLAPAPPTGTASPTGTVSPSGTGTPTAPKTSSSPTATATKTTSPPTGPPTSPPTTPAPSGTAR